MDYSNAHLYLPAVEALRDKELQWLNPNTGKWQDTDCAGFEYTPDCYRRRPKLREWWINEYAGYPPELFQSEYEAKQKYNLGRTIRVREVIE